MDHAPAAQLFLPAIGRPLPVGLKMVIPALIDANSPDHCVVAAGADRSPTQNSSGIHGGFITASRTGSILNALEMTS